MHPIDFSCTQMIPKPPTAIAAEMADMARWSEFEGYGPLPGITRAEYATRTPDMVGSRIRVYNADGSQHVEEIMVWQPEQQIVMRLGEFGPPLARLATHFIERWACEVVEGGTQVRRSIEMYPLGAFTRPLLWLISLFFRRAIAAHLRSMAE